MLQPILAIPLLTVLMAQGGLATYPHRGAVQGSASDGNTCYSTRGPLSYDPLRQICCADGVYEGAEANYICKICETTMFAIPKSSRPWRCCGRNNDQPYNPETSHCCFGQVKDGPEDTTSCFRCSADSIMSIPRDESKSYMCCGDQPYNTLRQHCCAGSLNNGPESAYICQSCGDNMMSRRRDLPPLRCCGVNNEISYDPSTHHCCGGFNQPKYGPQRDYVCQRCGNSYFSRPATDGSWRCCKGQPYNPAEQHCCFNGLHSGSEEHFTCQRCGNEVFSRRRDEPEYWCCSHPKTSEMTPYNPQSQTCCNGQIFSGPDNQHSCQVCGSTPFVRPSTDEPWRCCNTVTPYSPQRDHCCFGELRSGSEEQSTCVRCGKNLHTVPVNGQPWGCCGAEAFNPEREVCCNGQVYPGLVCGYEALPAPGTVLGLAAENVDSYSVGLRWYSPSNTQGLFGYRIFYRSASGGQESVVDTRSLGTSYTLSGLQPDSQYIIQVMAYGIAGDGQRSNTLRVQTAPEIGGSTPAQFVQARPRDSDSVDLEWNAPAGITTDRVQGYRILYKQTTETNTAYLDVGRPVSGTSFTLGGLEPHTDYDIVIVTIDDTGASSHSMPVRVRTAEGIPGPPGSLQRTAVGSNRLQVAWEPPASVNGVLEGYRLYYQVRGEDSPRVVELGPESTRYTLTGLESSTQYIVWVSAFTSAGEGLRSGNIAIRTSGGIPGAVRSLRGDPISPTSVRVQWERPTYNADGVQGYRLYYMQVGGRDIPAITLEGNLQSYIISGLQPNSGYEIWLVAFTSAGDGQESPHITVRTGSQETVYPPSQPQQPQLPGTPRDVRVSTVDPFTILVHWQPPTSGGDISNYLVYYQVADENRAISVQSGPNERSHLLGGLQPDTQYLIWIVAVSPVGVGLRSPAVPVQTQAVDVLPDAPRGLQVTPIGPTMIRVQWVPPRGGGAVSGYRIYYQVLGQPSLSLEADASERTRIIGQLLPNTEYTVWVLAFNPAGEDGSETQRFTVRTTAAVPGFVPRINVTAIDDTTLWVSWEAPETGAPVRGYRIYYQAMIGDQMPSTVETGPLVQSQAVSGLEPGIEYMIWIVAFSNQGDSEDSPRVRIRTNARVPDRAQPLPEILPVAGVPGIPQDIQGTSLSSSSIQVQWQEPATDAAPSGYRVYYQVVGEATISFKESRAEQRILIVEDLQPNTDYNIWVTAYSPAGTGQRSARITVRTLQETPQLPGVPDDVRVVDVGQTTIHVQWQRPRAGGDVTGYRIYYQPENQVSASAEVVNPSTLSYIIPGLQPDMEYTVWVVALSSLGMGLRSPLVTVRTEPTEGEADYTPEVPGMPEDVTAYATSAVSIRVEWQTPTQEDRVSGYRIRYQAEGDPAISTIEVDREERSYDIMALTPETDYTVWVVAFSAEGMGLRSPKVHARTPEDGPCDCDYVLDVDADKIKELYADKDEDTAEEVSTAQPGNPASPGAGSDTGDSPAAAGGGGTNEIAVAPVVDAFLDGDNGTSAGVGGGGTGTRVTIGDVNTDSLRAGADGNNMDSTDGQNGTGSGVPTTEAAVVDASFNGDNSGMPAVVQGGGTDTDVPGGSSSTGNLWNGAGGNNVDSQDGHNGTGSNASDSSTAGQGAHWEDSGTEAGSNNSLSNGTNSNNDGSISGADGDNDGSISGADGDHGGSMAAADGDHGGSVTGADGDHGGSMAGADGDHGGSVTGADGDHGGSMAGADGDHGGSVTGADGDHGGSMTGADGDNSGHEDEANGADGDHGGSVTGADGDHGGSMAGADGDHGGSVTGADGDHGGSMAGADGDHGGSMAGADGDHAGSMAGADGDHGGSVTGVDGDHAGSVTGADGDHGGSMAGADGDHAGSMAGADGDNSGHEDEANGADGGVSGNGHVETSTEASSVSPGQASAEGDNSGSGGHNNVLPSFGGAHADNAQDESMFNGQDGGLTSENATAGKHADRSPEFGLTSHNTSGSASTGQASGSDASTTGADANSLDASWFTSDGGEGQPGGTVSPGLPSTPDSSDRNSSHHNVSTAGKVDSGRPNQVGISAVGNSGADTQPARHGNRGDVSFDEYYGSATSDNSIAPISPDESKDDGVPVEDWSNKTSTEGTDSSSARGNAIGSGVPGNPAVTGGEDADVTAEGNLVSKEQGGGHGKQDNAMESSQTGGAASKQERQQPATGRDGSPAGNALDESHAGNVRPSRPAVTRGDTGTRANSSQNRPSVTGAVGNDIDGDMTTGSGEVDEADSNGNNVNSPADHHSSTRPSPNYVPGVGNGHSGDRFIPGTGNSLPGSAVGAGVTFNQTSQQGDTSDFTEAVVGAEGKVITVDGFLDVDNRNTDSLENATSASDAKPDESSQPGLNHGDRHGGHHGDRHGGHHGDRHGGHHGDRHGGHHGDRHGGHHGDRHGGQASNNVSVTEGHPDNPISSGSVADGANSNQTESSPSASPSSPASSGFGGRTRHEGSLGGSATANQDKEGFSGRGGVPSSGNALGGRDAGVVETAAQSDTTEAARNSSHGTDNSVAFVGADGDLLDHEGRPVRGNEVPPLSGSASSDADTTQAGHLASRGDGHAGDGNVPEGTAVSRDGTSGVATVDFNIDIYEPNVPALPGSPASIQARPTDMATVLVEWRQPTTSGRVDGYRIYYQASNNPQVASIDVGPQTLSQSVGGLESGTEYTFWVQAVNAAGLGYRSPVVTAITDAPAPSLPGVPQNVQATALSPMTILVEWEAPSLGGDVQGYMVYHQSREGGTTLREVGPSVNSLILSDLRPETRYSIWVVAHSDAGMGLRSSMKSLQTPAEGPRLPGRPMNVLATAIDAKSILVEWQQPTFGGPLDQYRIYYEKSTDQTTSMVEVGPGTVSYTLMDLLPDTEYSIWVVGLSNVGMGERSPIITVRTLEAPRLPETLSNVRVSPTGPTSITVEWEAPDSDDVQGYEIYYQTDNLPATSVEMGPDDRYYTISDLLPGQEYTVWLVALTFTGRRVSSQTFTIQTEQQALPGVPDNVRAFPTGPTSILVQWQLPSTGSDVQGYRIYSQAEHGHVSSVEVGPDTAFYTLTDLMPDTEYTVWVIAFSAAGMGDRSVSLAVRTEEEAPKVPGAPGSVRLTPSGPTSITVEWEAPTTGGDVEGYNVYYQPEDGNTRTAQVEPSDIPSYTIMGLTPNTLYTVWVIAFSSDGLGQRSQMVNVMTEQQAPQTPGVPRNVEASSTGPTTIVVQWASPDTGAEVQGYTIYYQPENDPTMRVQVSPSDIPYTIRDLLPDTQYTIWIVAFSTEGMGERSPALTVSTQEEAPATPGAPGSVRLTPSDPTSITVEWEAPTTGGDVEYYVIYYQAENEPTMRVQVSPSDIPYTIRDLLPDTQYTIWIVAFSTEGMGERSPALTVSTQQEAPKVPGAPGSVRLTPSDPTSITVEWEAPTTGGDVEYYIIYYQAENEPTMRVQVSPSDIPYTIRDLLPDTQYTIWIVAFSTEGMGERSPALTVSTQEAPNLPGAPGSVRLTPSDPTSITVEWEAPTTGGDVEYYVIYYRAENDPTMRVQVSPSDILYTIRDLLPDTQYTIWIVAFSTEGMGERSPALTVSTQEEAPATPGAPGSVRLTPSDPTSITVEWEAPTTGGDVEYYIIYYQAENEPTMRVQVSPSDIPYTIRDLLPDTQYTIWIVAFSTEGMGERSPALTVSTQEEAPATPGAPGSVRLTPSDPTSITVEWEAPTTGGDVEYYIIYYQAENEPTMRVQVSPSDIPYTIRDLLPDTQYTIWIVAFSTEGMGERSPALTVSTQEAPNLPGAPGNVRLTPSDPTSITVEWEAPTTGGDVEYYVIYYQTEDEPVLTVQLDQTMRQYTIEDLLPDTPYTVWIVAFSAEGEGKRSSVYYVQTAAEEIPGAPGNVQVTPFNATALTVEWEAPTRGGDFQGYRIYYEAPGDSTPGFVDTPSSVTSFLLTGLQPDTTYNVWVLAFSPAGMSQRSLMRTLTTLQVVQGPSAPAFIRASPLDGTSLVVEWEASESDNVQGYIIYYQAETETSPSSVEADPSTLQSTIRGLRPDTTYTLWVVSYSPEGTSPSSPTVSAQTLQEAPGLPGSPEGLRVRAVNPKTALLTWQEPSSGADFDGYRVYYQRVEDPESVTTVNVRRSSTSYILENLQPGQKYLMWIAAYSTRGVSEVTQRVDLRMPQGSLPGAPLNVRASSTEPTSIVVQWDSPRSGGDVERYQIYYRSSEDSSVSQIPVRGDELTWTITGLQTDVDYMVWIEAVNSEGSGPRSDVINVQTPSEAPGEPQNLQVESTELTSVTITWEAPTSGGELEGYRIYYQRVGDDGMRSPTRVIGPDERSFSLTGLEQGTDYRIYLVPFSSDRVGTSSPVLSVRTQSAPVPQPPGTPLSVRASALDSSSVRVTWRHPTRGGAAAGYKVHYQVAGEPEVVTVEVRPTDRALMLSGLRPSTSYDIWMTAFSPAGSSPRTPSVMVRTPEMAPQTPGRPRSIRAETLNPTTMYVQWQHPVRGTDLVERYRVYYQAVRAPTPSFRVARADETSITIPGMASSTTYNIWVVAVSAAGAGQPSPSITLATPDAVSEVPGSPEDIQVSLEDDSSIRVEWQPPTSGGEVLGYRINYQEAGNEDATTIEVGPYVYYQVIRRLKPDTEYYIWVVGFSSDGDGRRSQILSVTMESEGSTQLGPPADLQVSLLDDESVLLQWSAPETAAGILGYRLYYQPIGSTDVSNLEVGPDVSSHPIRGLEPGVDYVVWIVAFTQEGEGLRSAKMNVRIDRQVIGGSTYPGEGDRINIIPGVVVPNPSSGSTPDQEDRWALLGLPASPENVQVARVDSTTMRVQWMPPTSGGRVAGYRIYYQGPDDDESRSIDTPPSARTQTITGLVPGVDYNIWVLAFSLAGVGPQSDSLTVRTYPQGPVPRAPADVQMAVVNPSMVRLNWEPPTALSGPILGYRIFYNPILTNMLNVREVGPTVTEYSLMDLDPYLGYNIWVLAFTEAREGQRSLSIMLPPRAQRGSSVGGSASPREVTFTAMTPNSIKIQWEKPTDSVDVIDGYGILYRSAGEDQTQTIEVGVDESEYILTGLVPDTEYILQLLAFTASGQEYRSPQISVRTSASSQPDLGRVGVSGSSSISSTAHMSVVPSGGGTGRVIVRGGGDSGPRLPSGGQSFVIRTDANGQRSFILPNGESASGQGVQISPDGQGLVIRTDGSSTSNGQVFLVPANGGSATGGGGQTFVINPNQGGVITSSGGSSSSGGQAFLVPVSGSSGSTRDGQTVVHRFNGRPDDALQSGQTATTPAPEEGRDQDCYQDNGEEYRGQASTTEKGSQCVKWSASDFFQYSSHEYTQGEFGIGDHNYCRNPDGDAKPWCYADAEGTYEYCAIQQCRNGG
ncbi:uncharacterized protein [Branchiostoma lanceolatum]|uniref:uncharacterized protein isoform X2 n=1 Tax=Branchiostoma lanceolatum TaxID=7740 RepID=UPI003452B718